MCHGFMTHPLFFLHGFFSSDFTDESEAVLLIGLLTEFRRILAAGQWLAPGYVLLLFLVTQISQITQIFLRGIILSHRFHRYTQIFLRGIIFVTQISQMTQIFLRGIIFVTQISQMTQIFLRGIILSHRFHRFTQIFLRGIIFVTQISQIYTDFSSWDFLHSQGVSFLRGIIFVPQISQIYTDFLWNLRRIALSDLRGYL